MKITIVTFAFLLCVVSPCLAQQEIKVTPSSVNVYSQGATTIFLTYGNLGAYRPAETAWCGDVTPAVPEIGLKCAPGTVYGALPRRFDISRRSGNDGYTDIVSVPAAVARKAYQAAAAGEDSEFFYVRRFEGAAGVPDQFVAVTMRLTGNGAGAPFSLTDVQLGFGVKTGASATGSDPLVLFVEPGGKIPPISAEIRYTGTGRLRGRWEVARPGDPLPEPRDLLTEASLPIEERGTQARFAQLGRFNVFLPPGGRFTLPGPDPAQAPNKTPGQYLILLRIEASDDRENNSDLSVVGAGAGIARGGAAAGFPMPALRYVVGGGKSAGPATSMSTTTVALSLQLPVEDRALPRNRPIDFVWAGGAPATYFRLEVEDASGKPILSAVLPSDKTSYRAPSWLKEKADDGNLRWRVLALDRSGAPLAETTWRVLRLALIK
ncbi:MAG TPA: hypothetical protein VJ810_38490 [Blastocatellia bacterium]|nr:hypothetical protein [Blastocatellia bacterium]